MFCSLVEALKDLHTECKGASHTVNSSCWYKAFLLYTNVSNVIETAAKCHFQVAEFLLLFCLQQVKRFKHII